MTRRLPLDFEAQWRSRFEKLGRQFDSEAQIAGWTDNGLATRLRAFERRLEGVHGEWLDAGCGAGTYVRALVRNGAGQVAGADYSVPTLQKARALLGDEPVHWLIADVRRLPLADNRFDGALCFGVTQALSSSSELVSELVRVVRPGGEIWVDGLNARSLPHVAEGVGRRLRGRPARLRLERAATLGAALKSAGCSEVQVFWVPIAPSRLRGLQAVLEACRVERVPLLGPGLSHAFMLRARKAPAAA